MKKIVWFAFLITIPCSISVRAQIGRIDSFEPHAAEGGQTVLARGSLGFPAEFIAAFDWSVDKSRTFVWPFESLPPAPYGSVLVVIGSMPRAWPEKHDGKDSIPLSAFRCLQVNGRPLPKPRGGPDSPKEFRIALDQGRLRFSFSLPSGFRLDSRYTLIRIKLYRVSK